MTEHKRMIVAIGDEVVRAARVGSDRGLTGLQQWPVSRFATLTDMLLEFERASSQPLRGSRCAIGIFGATHGEAIMLSRGSWTISRAGLRAMLGQDPIIINDVAARAWAALGHAAGEIVALAPGGGTPPNFGKAGRWAFSNVERGVGLAVLDVDGRGRARVLECEMGHCIFAAESRDEQALAAALGARANTQVTWEMALTLSPDDPAWAAAGLPGARTARLEMLAHMLGRYLGETVLAHGSWDGVVVTGRRIADIVAERALTRLHAGFEHKPRFQRLLRRAPRWHLPGQDVTMAGLAVALDLHPQAADAAPTQAAA